MKKYNKSPVVKFKIPVDSKNNKTCDVFGENLMPIQLSEIKKDMEVICILELQGIKFFKQRFETEWNIIQLRTYNNRKLMNECLINESFLSDHEDNVEEDKTIENNKVDEND